MNKDTIDVYDELATDILSETTLSVFEARRLVRFLDDEGLIDYDTLKEYYAEVLDDPEESEDDDIEGS